MEQTFFFNLHHAIAHHFPNIFEEIIKEIYSELIEVVGIYVSPPLSLPNFTNDTCLYRILKYSINFPNLYNWREKLIRQLVTCSLNTVYTLYYFVACFNFITLPRRFVILKVALNVEITYCRQLSRSSSFTFISRTDLFVNINIIIENIVISIYFIQKYKFIKYKKYVYIYTCKKINHIMYT